MTKAFSESVLEEASLAWFSELGYTVLPGPDIEPEKPGAERRDFRQVLLMGRAQDAIARLNPTIPPDAREEALRKLTRAEAPSLIGNNRLFHRMLTDGIGVECRRPDGTVAGDRVCLIDFENVENNDWLVVNQFTVVEGQFTRRPDVVIFVNGLPLAVIELKNPADENATVWSAFNQLKTYLKQISSLFVYNEVLVISDGVDARMGSLSSDRERFMPWRTIEGNEVAPSALPQLEVLLKGVFERRRFLTYLRHFIVFEDDESGAPLKKLAAYHQFHAVNTAVDETVRASRITTRAEEVRDDPGVFYAGKAPGSAEGDRRCGVVWHTQGSGKSLTMAFYAGRVILHPAMENPTLVILTDRNDLDEQLFCTFSRCRELLRQNPVRAQSREELQALLSVASGGVVFTTIQKFFPEEKGDQYPVLSRRHNIVVIADEAHRSQYDFIDGFARHMRDALPHASFIGFTGTPLELTDKNTRAVFGDYISIYDIQRAVEDGATVPIFYESRLARLELKEEEKPHIDTEFEEVTEGEELQKKEKLKTKWAALEALVGTEKRLGLVARDIVRHFEDRLSAMDGKAMIVCMSRRICVELYHELVKQRPEWHNDDDLKGAIKIVMTGSASDPLEWQGHIRNKARREALAKRFKNSTVPFKIVIVRDMWLTGFDVPCLHTMYLDKPMKGHGLMQAIARVNRVFKDKPGGLVVDYLGLADALKRALSDYTESGGKGKTAVDQEEAVALMLEKYEVCCQIFHGFDWTPWYKGKPQEKLSLLPAAQEHVLAQEEGKNRVLKSVTELSQAFSLAVPHEKAIEIRDDVGFFQAVRSVLAKSSPGAGKPPDDLDHAIRQIVSKAVSSEEVVDIFAAAGLKKPDISILSDEFLAEIKGMPHKNLAVELLRKLLNDEIKVREKKYMVQARSFAELLERSLKAYKNRAVETAQVIEELIALARELREAQKRGQKLGLSDDELAFYDALEVNDSAVKILGDETLRAIARDLVEAMRGSVTIDWTVRENVRAQIRVRVRRILRKHGYPPDKQEKATQTVLEQAELLCKDWVG
ncbi:MAG: type I restriction endonuclease subunit R [Candidatus Eremiobacteraeota bacterium]|nr:type I restriction endonuclease subunit R [Candidatus Eremiobacteraeota bacterium]